MDRSKVFERELRFIKDCKIADFVLQCLNDAPEYFFEIPASSTGKYHPQYALGPGGLIRHTKAAVIISQDLLRLDMFASLRIMNDEIVAALILHDCCKNGRSGGVYTTTDHPLQASKFLQETADKMCISDFPFVKTIRDLIETHMGQWTSDFKTGVEVLQKPSTHAQKFVHICDYLASRKTLTVQYEDGNAL